MWECIYRKPARTGSTGMRASAAYPRPFARELAYQHKAFVVVVSGKLFMDALLPNSDLVPAQAKKMQTHRKAEVANPPMQADQLEVWS